MGEARRRKATGYVPPAQNCFYPSEPVYALPVAYLIAGARTPTTSPDGVELFVRDSLDEIATSIVYAGGLLEDTQRGVPNATLVGLRRQIENTPCDEDDMAIFDPLTGAILEYVPLKDFMETHTQACASFGRFAKRHPAPIPFRVGVKNDALRLEHPDGSPIDDIRTALKGCAIQIEGATTFSTDNVAYQLELFLVASLGKSSGHSDFLRAVFEGLAPFSHALTPLQAAEMAYIGYRLMRNGDTPFPISAHPSSTFGRCIAHCIAIDKMAAGYIDTSGVRRLARAAGVSIALFQPGAPSTSDQIMQDMIDLANHPMPEMLPWDGQNFAYLSLDPSAHDAISIPSMIANIEEMADRAPLESRTVDFKIYRDDENWYSTVMLPSGQFIAATWQAAHL